MAVENEGEFDDVGKSALESNGVTSQFNPRGPNIPPVERDILTMLLNGNVLGTLRELELHHHTRQACHEVDQLRDIVADISFQYSHVVHGAICRSVWMTAQKHIKSLHQDLVLDARIYTRCRSRLMFLKCDEHVLWIFRVLKRSDLKASTAILWPNIPGSSSLQLSWIWQTEQWLLFGANANATDPATPASLLECA
jgi:hypothetical protein